MKQTKPITITGTIVKSNLISTSDDDGVVKAEIFVVPDPNPEHEWWGTILIMIRLTFIEFESIFEGMIFPRPPIDVFKQEKLIFLDVKGPPSPEILSFRIGFGHELTNENFDFHLFCLSKR